MSSYSYQPKVFRYTNGCCICKAKSSSSRFTSSQKYESEFVHCFNLKEHRTGKICNACVLIFKRWRKLPERYTRNWEHVVDSKDKQGRKTVRKKTEKPESSDISKEMRKHRYIPKPTSRHDDFSDDQGLGEEFGGSSASSISGEERLNDGGFLTSSASSYARSPPNHPRYSFDVLSDATQKTLTALLVGAARRKQRRHLIRRLFYQNKKSNPMVYSEFVSNEFWQLQRTSNGVGCVGRYDSFLYNPEYHENLNRNFTNNSQSRASPTTTSISSNQSDIGSNFEDEGMESYDEEHSSFSMSPISSLHQSSSSLHQSSSSLHQSSSSLHQSSSPLHQSMAPLHQSTASLHQSTASLHQSMAPLHQSSSSLHQSMAPLHQSSSSLHQSTASSHLGMNMLMQLSAALRI